MNETFQYTSGFGPRWGTMHYGTDMAARHGSPILATADGVINFAGWEKGYGKLVKIKHDFGYETRYAHLSKISVKVGQNFSGALPSAKWVIPVDLQERIYIMKFEGMANP